MKTLPQVDGKYGAPMGRTNKADGVAVKYNDATGDNFVKFYLKRIRLNSGGYDSCGAYWGIGEPLYWASSDDSQTELWLRAWTRDEAKHEVRSHYPNAKFFR